CALAERFESILVDRDDHDVGREFLTLHLLDLVEQESLRPLEPSERRCGSDEQAHQHADAPELEQSDAPSAPPGSDLHPSPFSRLREPKHISKCSTSSDLLERPILQLPDASRSRQHIHKRWYRVS